MDALKVLSEGAGMEVPAPNPHSAKRAEQSGPLRDVMSAAQDWFVAQLQGIEGSEARDYLKRRGLSAAPAKAFGFGLSHDGRGRLKEALKRHGEWRLIEAGPLIGPNGDRQSNDRHRGPLYIPTRPCRA